MASQTTESFVARREGDFWINAVVGAVVAVVFSFVPVSPVLGGGVAGYLQQGTRTDGAKVGAVSGLIAALPVFAVVTLLFGGLGVGVFLEGSAVGVVLFWGIMLFAVVVTVLAAGGMGAVGGSLGVVLGERYDGDDRDEYERRPADPAVDPEIETPR